MNKIIVYPLTSLSTPFYRKKRRVEWTPSTPLTIVRVVDSESVIVKPFGKGCYRELEVSTSLLGVVNDHAMPLRANMSIAEAIKHLEIR